MSRQPALLVIDDNTDLVENLCDIFEARGFVVTTAPSAGAGLRHARTHGFDLAFVDVNLPDASGLEVLPSLRHAAPLGEVVVMTGHATIDSAIAAVRGGAFHYVVKPFKPDDLIAAAESALRQVELRRERATLAQQLEVSERRYRDVIESSQLLVVGLDPGGRVLMANRRLVELSGRAHQTVVGERFVPWLFPVESRSAVDEHLRAVSEGGGGREFEAPVLAGDGRGRTVRWHATASIAPHGEPTLYLVGTDVTERLRLERRAAEAEALAYMGTLATGLAHEIRNPLNAAGLQLHLLGKHLDRHSEDDRRALRGRVEIVAAELKRLERLLGDFLELARPRPMAREPVDVALLVTDVLSLHEPDAHGRGIALRQQIAPAVALGDHGRLKQVFHNLVVNALEATPSGGTVTVEVRIDRDDATFVQTHVGDTGRGIPTATLERVFEPFFTTKEAGTGLGLPIVRQIVQRHGGTVTIESTEGVGTTVGVRLPAAGLLR